MCTPSLPSVGTTSCFSSAGLLVRRRHTTEGRLRSHPRTPDRVVRLSLGGYGMDVETLKDTPPWDWPLDAGTLFLALLGDRQANAAARLVAAELAGDFTVINDALAEALLAVVCCGDDPEALRVQAAMAFGLALEHAETMGFEDAEDVLLSEATVHRLEQSLHRLFQDAEVPQALRRQLLEVTVRAPQAWHPEAVRTAYGSSDIAWRRTAIFCMRFIRGFEAQILEALASDDPDMHYHAVCAAGTWEIDAAWSHIVALVTAEQTDKSLRLAAIDAAASIRPHEAPAILGGLTDVDDEDIVEAVFETLTMVEGRAEDGEDAEDDEESLP
jgi:hypothetical protein